MPDVPNLAVERELREVHGVVVRHGDARRRQAAHRLPHEHVAPVAVQVVRQHEARCILIL